MNTFEEKMGSIFLLNESGEAQYEVTAPAILFDKEFFVLHKIGNHADVSAYYEKCIEKCKQTGSDLYESWVVMDLPLDAALLNRLLQRTSSLETILKDELKLSFEF